jgi:CBS domain-containing protein
MLKVDPGGEDMVKSLTERHDQHRDIDHWPVTAAMSAPTVAVLHTATMEEALQALAVSGLRHLAVIDGLGVCAGLLTDRTVAAAWAADPMTFDRLPVAHVMDSLQSMINARATVADAARMMRRCETDAVVVVGNDHRPIGVLTAGDLVALLAKPQPA